VIHRFLALGLLFVLSACVAPEVPEGPGTLGDFRLGYNIVQAKTVKQGPFSRQVSDEQLTGALTDEIERRLGRYDGDGLYHLGVAIGGFVLAQPGIPLIYTPKSVLILEVNLYDNATQARLNPEPKQITAFEGINNAAPIIGSGIARGAEEQLDNLVTSAAFQIEQWLKANPGWFTPKPGQPRVQIDRATLNARSAAAIVAGGNTTPGAVPAN